MFEQSPTLGPGISTVTQHSAEILILMLGAFVLGALLLWFLTAGTRHQLRQSHVDLMRLRERLTAAERRPPPAPRLRESNSSEHERTLTQLRESREAEAVARERIIELEARLALAPLPLPPGKDADKVEEDAMSVVLPFITPNKNTP